MCACVVFSEIKVDLRFSASADPFMDQRREQVFSLGSPYNQSFPEVRIKMREQG